ncbi:hypothetical protein CCR75_008977 [Bremia lactucae]|uniref:Secreted RxLR effector n=1 Tax=Bremia lactucae TaxID=4779 RepID=A0A3B7TND7_BRELC|nr:secreted RxLR effector [Bremia lactucae]TDH72361.1 hypothetical protein CCR75_008977 [Bremia lactucae]
MNLIRAMFVAALVACTRNGVHAKASEADLVTLLTTNSEIVTSQRLLRTSAEPDDNDERAINIPFITNYNQRTRIKAPLKELKKDSNILSNVKQRLALERVVRKEIYNRGGYQNAKKVLEETDVNDPGRAILNSHVNLYKWFHNVDK